MPLTVRSRSLRKRRSLLEDFSVPPPESLASGGGANLRLRDIITHVVREEVRGYNERANERRFDRVLSAQQVDRAASGGSVRPGATRVTEGVEAEGAVRTALQAFEDGLYLVVIDEVERRALDEVVFLAPDSVLTFIRLTFLAGA